MYLGVEITSSKNLQREVRAQINKASRMSGYLRDPIWRNKYTSAESRDTTKAKNMMRAGEMKTDEEQIRSKVIKEYLEIQDSTVYEGEKMILEGPGQ
ncbi:hypothetical protein Trydic_g2309 [Trypoxylus dichotomus]